MHSPRDRDQGGARGLRFEDIKVLCGLAVILVLLQHLPVAVRGAPPSDPGPGLHYLSFWPGIDLLFAAAGFLAARELAPRLATASGLRETLQTVGRFWLRCAWRVLPSAWLWLVVTVTCTLAFNRSAAFGAPAATIQGALASLLNLENVRVALLGQGAAAGPTFAYWALSLAAQFCLVLPLVVALCRPRLWIVLAVPILLQLFRGGAPGDPSSFLRPDALLLGAVIAVWARSPTHRLFAPAGLAQWSQGTVLVPALLLCLLTAAGSTELNLVPFRLGVVAVLAAALVWLASYGQGFVLPDGSLAKRLLAWIGARALPLYLVHLPVFLATREIWFRLDPASLSAQPPHQLRFLATALMLVVGLAELSHRLIELPLRRLEPPLDAKRAAPPPPTVAPALAEAGALRPRDD